MSEHEKIFPAPDILNEVEYGKFVLTNLAAKRAKQIKEGAPPLVRIDTSHPLSIALAEIAAGKIKPILGADAQAAELDDDFAAMDDLAIDDLGMLLPAVEDDDELVADALIGLTEIGLDDEEPEIETVDEAEDPEVAALLVEEGEETVAAEDEAISLDDLAEEEEAAAEDEPEL